MHTEKLATVFSALANTRRLAIVLMANPEVRRQDIITKLHTSGQNADKHINALLRAGVIFHGPKYGREITFTVNSEYIELIKVAEKVIESLTKKK